MDSRQIKNFRLSDSQDYELVEHVEADGGIPVSYYRNKVTGLKIFLAHAERPIVKGNFAFATEAHDDDGLPHTLEHLVFMGSEKYPYKGVLDLLATRSFSYGTNALTDTDYTSYDLVTAGAEGFLNLLPVYLDHLFFPLLTDEAYTTEIHHINGRGEDGGVVYCEMQARENSGDERCHLEMEREMYPGHCGYKSNTGGLMLNIRKLLTNQKIKNYHARYYVPKNFCIIITGPVEPEALFKSIKPVEDKLYERFAKLPEMQRPWTTPVPPLEKSVTKTIQYPCDADEDGLVYLGYRGPAAENFEECVAITLLTEYLNQPSISPFQKEFVECDAPLCSSIDAGMVENLISFFYFTFESVVIDQIPKVVEKVHEILNRLVSGEEEFDGDRMNIIISRRKVGLLLSCEKNPHSKILDASLSHFLYGVNGMKDKYQLNRILDRFESVDKYYWLGIITKYMVGPESRYVCINGIPSSTLMASMMKEEEKRINDQRTYLKDQLAIKEKELQHAKDHNERPVPAEVLSSFPVPSIDNIKFFEITTHSPQDSRLPFTVRYDNIKTNFVSIYVALNTSHSFNEQDRLYIPLLEQLLFESPIIRDGKLIPHQDVVRELFADTISMDITTGLSKALSNIFLINLQVEVRNYTKAVNWIREILFNTQFPAERIKTIAKRMIGDISQIKRQGEQVVGATSSWLLFKDDSNNSAENFMKQQVFLKSLLKKLKSDPQAIEADVIRVRDLLTNDAKNMYAHLSLNDKLFANEEEILKPWFNIQSKGFAPFEQSTIVQNYDLLKLTEGEVSGVAIPVGSVESNYLHQFVPSIKDPYHEDIAGILVLLKYFTQLEGPLWRVLRGRGLSYHYSMSLSMNSGLMYFTIERSTLLVEAYEKMIEVVMGHIESNAPYVQHLVESAKSCLIYQFIANEKNPDSKSIQSFKGFLLNTGPDYDRHMLSKIAKVKSEDLVRIGKEHLTPLFRGQTRSVSVCCPPVKLDEILTGLNAMGCNIKTGTLDDIK